MSEGKGKKRSKAYYRKSAHGGKRQKTDSNHLKPGIQGFLIMCNTNEMSAVREGYNILNEYADAIYGQGKSGVTDINDDKSLQAFVTEVEDEKQDTDSDDDDDIEAALKKEVAEMKAVPSELKRFQNCKTQAKNCIFIRSTVADPVKVAVSAMEDIAKRQLSRARFAARLLPVVGTCKAHTPDIIALAERVLRPVFARSENPPLSYTIIFKARNNNTSSCGKTSVIPTLTQVVKEINTDIEFTWSDFELAILVEIVCKVCCLVVAPGYTRLRKYNIQELVQGPKCLPSENKDIVTQVDFIFDKTNTEEPNGNDTVAIENSQGTDLKENVVDVKENQDQFVTQNIANETSKDKDDKLAKDDIIETKLNCTESSLNNKIIQKEENSDFDVIIGNKQSQDCKMKEKLAIENSKIKAESGEDRSISPEKAL